MKDEIYLGDCLEVMKQIPDDSVDMIITSPPYNYCLRVRGGKYTHRTKGEKRAGLLVNKYINERNDSLEIDDYFEWQKDCINEMLRICRGTVFYNIQLITGNKLAIFRLFGAFADRIKDVLVWDKCGAEPAIGWGVLNSEYELIIAFSKDDCKGRMFKDALFERGKLSNVLRIRKNHAKKYNHRAAFPILLPQTLIHNFRGGVILDPFMGSGTTCVAAIKEKRHYIGIEKEKKYFEIAQKRINEAKQQLTLF